MSAGKDAFFAEWKSKSPVLVKKYDASLSEKLIFLYYLIC
jgi:hypothetical protein